MAIQPPKRCTYPGCSSIVWPPVKRCTEHPAPITKSSRSKYHRDNNYFYSSPRWRKIRKLFLQQHPICNRCNALATVVDHVKPISSGGKKYTWSNLQSLCAACHNSKTAAEQKNLKGEGGANLCKKNKHLPRVQQKKPGRGFWGNGLNLGAKLKNLSNSWLNALKAVKNRRLGHLANESVGGRGASGSSGCGAMVKVMGGSHG